MQLDETYRRMRKENNTLLMNVFMGMLSLGAVVILIAEILAVSGVHKWKKSMTIFVVLLVVAIIPLILRKFKISEKILTYVMMNLFIFIILGLIFLYPYNTNLWALSLCVIGFAILFLDKGILLYSMGVLLLGNILFLRLNSQYLGQSLSAALIGRISIFFLFVFVAIRVSDRHEKMLQNNFTQLETIHTQNQYNEKLIHNIITLSGSLKQLGEQVKEAVSQSSEGVGEIAANAMNIAAHSDESTSMMTNAYKKIEMFTESTSQIFDNMKIANQGIEKMQSMEKENEKNTAELEQAMIEITKGVENVDDGIQQIHDNSNHIQSMVQQIEEIANQTNMLAINAAIESARAGDAGRGFAVVAEEVGKLAAKSKDLSSGIIHTIDKNHQAVLNSVDSIRSTIDKVESGIKITDGFKQYSLGISENAKVNAERIAQVYRQMEKQMAYSEEFRENILYVTNLTQKTNQEIESSVAVTEQISAAMDEIEKTMVSLSDMIISLNGLCTQTES